MSSTHAEGHGEAHGPGFDADTGHGNTPAAWTAVLLCIAGFLLGGAGLVTGVTALAIVGGAVALVSPIIGAALSAMGLGAPAK